MSRFKKYFFFVQILILLSGFQSQDEPDVVAVKESSHHQLKNQTSPVQLTPVIKQLRTQPGEIAVNNPLKSTEDLNIIKNRGFLRVLALDWENNFSLPRSGIPQNDFTHKLELYANSLNLKLKWVLVKNRFELFEFLENGFGDIIARNTTIPVILGNAGFSKSRSVHIRGLKVQY